MTTSSQGNEQLVRRAALARAITALEEGNEEGDGAERDPGAHVIGITGPPGVGKSTTVAALIERYLDRGDRVAVLAVDPSSARTGGALLGDRARMRSRADDDNLYVRSLAARSSLGGLSKVIPKAVRLLASQGYSRIIVETVGVGQSEVDIVNVVDTVVVVLAPRAGDEIQLQKAGVLEIGDVLALNKSDDPAAAEFRASVVRAVRQRPAQRSDAWRVVVASTCAVEGDVSELVAGIEAHLSWTNSRPSVESSRARVRYEVEQAVLHRFTSLLRSSDVGPVVQSKVEAVISGRATIQGAATAVLGRLRDQLPAAHETREER